MTEPRDQIAELQRQAGELPYGPSRVALLEEAVALADSVNELDRAYQVRKDLIGAATFSGRPDVTLVAFSWCLTQHDRDPERFNQAEILWQYKWVVGNSWSFPEISRPRLEQLLADMERRYREAGSTLFAVSKLKRDLYMHFGENHRARAIHAEFRKRRRDYLSDCPACMANANCNFYCEQRQWGRAMQAALPVLRNRLRCTEEPHRILSLVLCPLFHLGRVDEAKAYQRQGYRLVSAANHFVRQQAEHLQFLVLIGDMAQAKRLLERHLPGALEYVTPDERFLFLLAARLWTDRLASGGTRALKVRLPKDLPASVSDGKSSVNELGEWFTAQAQEIARRFDARNGTSAFAQRIDELPELLRLAMQ